MDEGHNDQHYEKILARFANPIDSDEEDAEDSKDQGERWKEDEKSDILTPLSASKELRYEFKVAFDLVAGGSRYMDRSKIFDLMLALGYTFQDADVDELLDGCITVNDEDYAVETLLEAFERWYCKQLKFSEVKALFAMLIRERESSESGIGGRVMKENIISSEFPHKLMHVNFDEKIKDQFIDIVQLKDALNQVLNKTGHEADSVSPEEVNSLLKEIASFSREKITFEEFIGLFKVYF